MSVKVNIPKSVTDQFYRYKRDIIIIEYIHKNGVQTKLSNIDVIAKQLKVDIKDITSYFKKKLGVSLIQNIRIQGQIELKVLENNLEKYIEKYILCKNCRLPELNDMDCKACGYSNIKTNKVGRDKFEDIANDEKMDILEVQQFANKKDIESSTCKIMHRLYDTRDKYINKYDEISRLIVQKLEIILEQCWKCITEDQLLRIKNKIKKLNNEIETNKITPIEIKKDKHSEKNIQNHKQNIKDLNKNLNKDLNNKDENKYNIIEITPPIETNKVGGSMMLRMDKPAKDNDIFLLPHGQGELSCINIKQNFPEFAKAMDGTDHGACLLLYYDRNPLNQRYEFRDADSEHDISELLGLDFNTISKGESHDEENQRHKLETK